MTGRRREILSTRSVHLFCPTERRAVFPGLLALKLLTTMPTNSWRPMLTPKKMKMCRKTAMYWGRGNAVYLLWCAFASIPSYWHLKH